MNVYPLLKILLFVFVCPLYIITTKKSTQLVNIIYNIANIILQLILYIS